MTTEINATKSSQVKATKVEVKTEELSEETKQQLAALGITAEEGMTEEKAKELIEEARMEEADKLAPEQEAGVMEISADIKNLASVVGLSYEDNATPDDILIAIAEELEAQIDESENNPQALSTLMSYYHTLNSLDAQLDAVYQGESKLFNAMELMAANNRKQFGF